MYHMKTATVRDLRYDFPKIEELLSQGEEVQITKRGKVIGKVVPAKQERPPLPDFLGRIRAVYGNEMLPTTGAEVVRMDRDRY
jgi:antitoxin (DNA-binding transcriptional repressor) of toxin-antitoxin stability system